MLCKYFNILILFGTFFLGIIGTFAEKNELSSDIQIRKKRVINPSAPQDNLIRNRETGFIVSIERRGSRHCIGSIMKFDVIITVAHCVEHAVTEYQVLSSSQILGGGIRHNVSNKIVHEHYNPKTFENDLALLVIHPRIVETPNSHRIQLYQGNLQPSTTGSIIGWACPLHSGKLSTNYNLRQKITVPIMKYDRCANIYRNTFPINEKNICTFDTIGNKRCGVGDYGAPLVVRNQLVGMYICSGTLLGKNKPDVFVYLQHHGYIEWIETKLYESQSLLYPRSHQLNPVRNSQHPNPHKNTPFKV